MVRLQEQLKYFVVKKVSTDPLWHGVRVYLSGHEVGNSHVRESSWYAALIPLSAKKADANKVCPSFIIL